MNTNNPPDDGLSSEDHSEWSVTCSLASTRMSSNQTCDDLPGPGRLIDTYIYQPAGRYLERQINRIFEPRESQKLMTTTRKSQLDRIARPAKYIINTTFDAIDSFLEPALMRTLRGDEYSCRYAYWTRNKWTSVTLSLSDYLYILGAQDFVGWGHASLVTHCGYVMSLVRSFRSNIRIAAITAAFLLVDSIPRLRQYFDLRAIHHAMRDDNVFNVVLLNIVREIHTNEDIETLADWKLRTTFAERDDIDDLVQRTSESLPRARIPNDDVPPYNPVLLSLITEGLRSEEIELCQYMASNFALLISQFLRIPDLFSFHNVEVDWMDPVVVFWRDIKGLLGKLPPFRAPADIDFLLEEPTVVDDLLFKHLRGRLMDTLRAFPSTDQHESEDDDELTTEFTEDFARLCLDIQLRLSARQIMYTSPASADWIQLLHDDEEKSEARALIASSLALEEHKVNAIWEECYSSLTSTYERKEGPSFQLVVKPPSLEANIVNVSHAPSRFASEASSKTPSETSSESTGSQIAQLERAWKKVMSTDYSVA